MLVTLPCLVIQRKKVPCPKVSTAIKHLHLFYIRRISLLIKVFWKRLRSTLDESYN